jgi:hypothetical protein
VYKILILLACVLVSVAGCGSDSEGGNGGGDSPCEENMVPGPTLPGGEDVMFTIESSSGTRRVPGKVTGTRRGELELRAQCIVLQQVGGFTLSISTDLPSEVGRYDASSPALDPDDAAMGDKAIEHVSASYFVEKIAPYDRAGIPLEESTDVWQMYYGFSGGEQEPFLTDDFELELTELLPYEGEDLPWFDTVPHGSVKVSLIPSLGTMAVVDDARDPIAITAVF